MLTTYISHFDRALLTASSLTSAFAPRPVDPNHEAFAVLRSKLTENQAMRFVWPLNTVKISLEQFRNVLKEFPRPSVADAPNSAEVDDDTSGSKPRSSTRAGQNAGYNKSKSGSTPSPSKKATPGT